MSPKTETRMCSKCKGLMIEVPEWAHMTKFRCLRCDHIITETPTQTWKGINKFRR